MTDDRKRIETVNKKRIEDIRSYESRNNPAIEFLLAQIDVVDKENLYLRTKLIGESWKDGDKFAKMEEALRRIMATAGHPNAAEGCRIILKLASEALGE